MNVVELYPSNYRDIPKTLRVIADQMEAGTYGHIKKCAVVTFDCQGNVELFGLGSIKGPEEGAFILQMGINHAVQMAKDYARQNGE